MCGMFAFRFMHVMWCSLLDLCRHVLCSLRFINARHGVCSLLDYALHFAYVRFLQIYARHVCNVHFWIIHVLVCSPLDFMHVLVCSLLDLALPCVMFTFWIITRHALCFTFRLMHVMCVFSLAFTLFTSWLCSLLDLCTQFVCSLADLCTSCVCVRF